MKFSTIEEAHNALGRYVLAFIGTRAWEEAGCTCRIYSKMSSGSHWLKHDVVEDKTGGFEGDSEAMWAGLDAALFLRDHLLRTTGQRIWGLTFTLYPDGKFNIEYDYNKPEGYEETDGATESGPTGLANAPADGQHPDFLAQSLARLQQRTAELGQTWGLGSEANWHLDMNAGVLTFTFGDGRVVEKPVQVIGTFDTNTGTFLWGWDHPSVPEPLRRAAHRVRDYGAVHGIDKLTTRQVECNEFDAWEFTAAAFVLDAAEGAYRGSAGSTLVYMTFDEN